jgi:hypothetical protein
VKLRYSLAETPTLSGLMQRSINILWKSFNSVWNGAGNNHLVRPSVHTFVADISASTGRNDFIFDIWFWHGDLYHVSPFQAYCTSTTCLPRDLEFFMFAIMKSFVTGETRYKSLCQSHVSKIKSFLPVAAETSLTKVWTDGRTDGQGDCNIAPSLW